MSAKHDIPITISGQKYLVYVKVIWICDRPMDYEMEWFRWEGKQLVECDEPHDAHLSDLLHLQDEAIRADEYQRDNAKCNTPENRWAEEMERRAELKREREEEHGCGE